MKLSQILQGIRYELAAARDLNNEAIVHIREAERRISNLTKLMGEEADLDEDVDKFDEQ